MIQPPPPPLAPRLLPRAGVALASSAASFVLCCLRPRSLSPGSAGLPHNPHALRNLIKVVVPISQKGKLAPSQAQPLGGKAHWGRATSGEGLREVALWGPGLGRYEGTGDLPVLGALEHQSLGILAGACTLRSPPGPAPGPQGVPGASRRVSHLQQGRLRRIPPRGRPAPGRGGDRESPRRAKQLGYRGRRGGPGQGRRRQLQARLVGAQGGVASRGGVAGAGAGPI
jgi:hypothetical protein